VGTHTIAVTATNCATAMVTDTHEIVIHAAPVCTEVTAVDLTLVTMGTIYTDTVALFSADIAPDDAAKPYTYTVDFGDSTAPLTGTDNADPLLFTHTFPVSGTRAVEIGVWNCAMSETQAVTDRVMVATYPLRRRIYLPLILRSVP
jgi:hypothetical protein